MTTKSWFVIIILVIITVVVGSHIQAFDDACIRTICEK
jgi:hypothetical protein